MAFFFRPFDMIPAFAGSLALIAVGFMSHSYFNFEINSPKLFGNELLVSQGLTSNNSSEPHPSFDATKAPKLSVLLSHYRSSLTSQVRPFRIMQIGDSHTAADFFTEHVRSVLQGLYGNAGIGWILPAQIEGQRATRYQISQSGSWSLTKPNSKNKLRDTPLGGYVNTGKTGAAIEVRSLSLGSGKWGFHALVRSSAIGSIAQARLEQNGIISLSTSVNDQWTEISIPVNQPHPNSFKFFVGSGNLDVAGFWLEKDVPGVVLDHVGKNGASLDVFSSWSDKGIMSVLQNRPIDLFILQFGTNESVGNVSADNYFNALRTVINRLHYISPNSSIVLITPPSFSSNRSLVCGTYRPPSFKAVLQAQMLASERLGVSLWNWEEAMGGECSVTSWAKEGLMAHDFIHLSPSGYLKSADSFLKWLLDPPSFSTP